MNKFAVKYQQWGTVTPFKVFDCDEQDEPTDTSCLQMLQDGLQAVLSSLEEDRRQYELRFALKLQNLEEKLQQKEEDTQELTAVNESLKMENGQLKASLEQMVRFAKRYELKQQLLSNKISHLTQQLTEKQAVIRYLEAKTHPAPTPSPNPTSNPNKHMLSSLTHEHLHDDTSFKAMPDLSAYGIAKNVSNIKFEDFKVGLRSDKVELVIREGVREGGKGRRNRTESNQNENGENVSWRGSSSKLGELLSARAWGRKEEERSLLKKYPVNCDYSFWKYSNKPQAPRSHRSSSGMLASTCFLESRQNASFSREYSRAN